MTDVSHLSPTTRFSGLADVYARSRPDYPAEAVRFVLARCGLAPGAVLADVGCGTGISSRLFAAQGLRVVGVEPNAEMRARAAAEPWPGPGPAPEYRDGSAEATGLPDACADAVLAAQAFHWFRPGPALAEFRRVLRPGGWVALLWNHRDEREPFTAAYGEAVRRTGDAAAIEEARYRSGEALLQSPLFTDGRLDRFAHGQELTEEVLIARALSVSYAPREPEAVERYRAELSAAFARFQQGGRVRLCYETYVYTARAR